MVASSGASVCSTCATGQEADSSNTYCEPCPVGSWGTIENGVAICQLCTSPFTSLEVGQTSCSHCAAKYYRAPCSATSRIREGIKYIGFGVFVDETQYGSSTDEVIFKDANERGQRAVPGCGGAGGLMDGHASVNSSYACLSCQGILPASDDDGDRLGRSKRMGMKCSGEQSDDDAVAGVTIETLALFGGGDLGVDNFNEEIPGYWRFSPYSNDIFRCDVADACKGGALNMTLTAYDDDEGLMDGTIMTRDYEWWTQTTPPSWQKDRYNKYSKWQSQQCGVGYEGPICSRCAEEFFRDSWYGTCLPCQEGDDINLSPPTIAFIVLVVGIMLFSLGSTFIYRKQLEAYYDRNEGRFLTMSHHATTIFITWQIVSALPAANKYSGGGGYPDPFSQFATFLEMFSLDFFSLFHLDCLQGTDYYYKL